MCGSQQDRGSCEKETVNYTRDRGLRGVMWEEAEEADRANGSTIKETNINWKVGVESSTLRKAKNLLKTSNRATLRLSECGYKGVNYIY